MSDRAFESARAFVTDVALRLFVGCGLLLIAIGVALSITPRAQDVESVSRVPVLSETMTITGSVVEFAAGTKTTLASRVASVRSAGVVCVGTLETAAIRYTLDGTTPTSTVGHPLAVDQQLRLDGLSSVQGFKSIRTTGTSGVIYWTCYV